MANTVRDVNRQRRRRREVPFLETPDPGRTAEDLMQEKQMLALLREMISLLPKTYRQVIELRLYEGSLHSPDGRPSPRLPLQRLDPLEPRRQTTPAAHRRSHATRPTRRLRVDSAKTSSIRCSAEITKDDDSQIAANLRPMAFVRPVKWTGSPANGAPPRRRENLRELPQSPVSTRDSRGIRAPFPPPRERPIRPTCPLLVPTSRTLNKAGSIRERHRVHRPPATPWRAPCSVRTN